MRTKLKQLPQERVIREQTGKQTTLPLLSHQRSHSGEDILRTRDQTWRRRSRRFRFCQWATRLSAASHVMSTFSLLLCVFLGELTLLRGELWEEDLTSAMTIGLSTTGYKSVDLRCGSSHFSVNVTLEDDFRGIVYTRGSFKDKKLPCFKNHRQGGPGEGKKFTIGLRIPFDGCGTVMDVAESRYTNTLVVQHDPDLIMPGDAAFSLNCAFVPEFKVASGIEFKEPSYKSKIILVDADPAAAETSSDKQNVTVSSKSEQVTFVPNSSKKKDEL